MKRIEAIYIALLFITVQAYSQITVIGPKSLDDIMRESEERLNTVEEVINEIDVPVINYDSLTNIPLSAHENYKEQTLIFTRSGVIENQIIINDSSDVFRYSHLKSSSGKPIDDSKYLGKYFRILYYEPVRNYLDQVMYEILYLKEVESGDVVTVGDAFHTPDNYFVCEGYIDKLKAQYIGQEYSYYKYFNYKGEQPFLEQHLTSVDTGIEIIPENKSTWKCVDVAIKLDEIVSPILLVFENEKGVKAYHKYSCDSDFPIYCYEKKTLYGEDDIFSERLFLGCFITNERRNELNQKEQEEHERLDRQLNQYFKELTRKYGSKNADLIIEGSVKIGWSKQMCRESWGEPERINKTTNSSGTHEQWCYPGSQYLYFDNGKLTSIQQ